MNLAAGISAEDRNRVAFLRWLSTAHPDLYRASIAKARARGGIGLGRMGWINFVVQAVATVGSAVLQKKQVDKQVALQKKGLALSDAQAQADREQQAALALLEVNAKRAAVGQPPVDITGKVLAQASLPTPSALTPYVGQSASGGQWITGVPNYVTGIGAAVLAVGVAKLARVF